MINRFDELANRAAQATQVEYNNAYWQMPNGVAEDTAWRNKFAELILRDVLIICQNVATPFEDDSTNVSGAEICLEMIKENFGIKE